MTNSINKSEKVVYYFFSSHYKKIIFFIFFTLIFSTIFSYINYKKNLRYVSNYDIIFNRSVVGIVYNIIGIEEISSDFIFFLKKNKLKNRHEYLESKVDKLKVIRIKINHVSLDEKNIAEVNRIQNLIESYKEELIDRINLKANSINDELNAFFKMNSEVVANQKIEDPSYEEKILQLHRNKSMLLDTITFIKKDNLILESYNGLINKTLSIRQVFTKNLLTSLICSLSFILFLLWIKICISEVRKD